MSTVAGYTICFIKNGRIKQFTFAVPDDAAILMRLEDSFGKIEVISRAPLDQNALRLLKLKQGDWLEWVPLRPDDERNI